MMLTYANPQGHMGHLATPAQLPLPAPSLAPPPPAAFAALSDNAQMAFFAKRKKDKEESKKSVFSYKTIRNHLLYTLTAEVTRQRKVSAGGTYLPLSVYEQRGYTIDPGFTWRNPSRWS